MGEFDEVNRSVPADQDQAASLQRLQNGGRLEPGSNTALRVPGNGDDVLGRVDIAFQDSPRKPGTPEPPTPEPLPAAEAPPADTPKPAEVKAGDRAAITGGPKGISKIEQTKHKFSLELGRDEGGNLNQITTKFDPSLKKPDQVYTKDDKGWYFHGANGQQVRMQGDLKVNPTTGEFTQVLRRDVDGDGGAVETTRTMDIDGTDTVSRMDKTKTAFKYDASGKMTEWVETDKAGKADSFKPITDEKGRPAWKNNDGLVRYDPKIEDNGNVTFRTSDQLDKKDLNQVVTSSGDQITNGENGVKYDFNYRGDVSSIRFPTSRLFEGQRVNRIDIGYRDPDGNQGQIIDRLSLYNDQNPNAPFMHLQRVRDTKAENVYDQFNAFDGQGRQLVSKTADNKLVPYALTRDIAVKDGLLSVSEHLPAAGKDRDQMLAAVPNIKKALDQYKKDHPDTDPTRIVTIYKNSGEFSQTNSPRDDEYESQVFEGIGLTDPKDIDMFVPGETGYKMNNTPAPPVPRPPIPGGSTASGRRIRA